MLELVLAASLGLAVLLLLAFWLSRGQKLALLVTRRIALQQEAMVIEKALTSDLLRSCRAGTSVHCDSALSVVSIHRLDDAPYPGQPLREARLRVYFWSARELWLREVGPPVLPVDVNRWSSLSQATLTSLAAHGQRRLSARVKSFQVEQSDALCRWRLEMEDEGSHFRTSSATFYRMPSH